MSWEEIHGRIDEVKGTIRKQWGKLTDDDVDRWSGRRDELVGKLRQRYGKTKAAAEQMVDDLIKAL